MPVNESVLLPRNWIFAVYPVIGKNILTSRSASYVHVDAAALP
jgi:hypothetical protein